MPIPAVRTALAVPAALLLTLLTACGDSSDGDSHRADGPGTRRTTAPAAPSGPLSARELSKRSLTEGDVKGLQISRADKGGIFGDDPVSIDRKRCRPLGLVLNAVAPGKPVATVQGGAAPDITVPSPDSPVGGLDGTEPMLDLPIMAITLASYQDTATAERQLAALQAALKPCRSGFAGTGSDEELRYTAVTRDRAPAVGDAALAFTATGEVEGVKGPEKVVVFRTGSTLTCITAYHPLGQDFTIPQALIETQAAKLS
jgi:hypothetical protein